MEFEFVLPQKHEDLLDATGRAYCVTQHYKQSECSEKIRREFLQSRIVLVTAFTVDRFTLSCSNRSYRTWNTVHLRLLRCFPFDRRTRKGNPNHNSFSRHGSLVQIDRPTGKDSRRVPTKDRSNTERASNVVERS